MQDNHQFLSKLANLESITWLDNPEDAPLCATALAGDLEILVPMAGIIDVDAELARLDREIEKNALEAKKLYRQTQQRQICRQRPSRSGRQRTSKTQ